MRVLVPRTPFRWFPPFRSYVESTLQGEADNSWILEGMVKHGGFKDKADAMTHITYSSLPEVMVRPLRIKTMGLFDPLFGSDYISINEYWIDLFFGIGLPRYHQPLKGQMIHVIGVVVLHELIHWRRYHSEKQEQEGEEAGTAWEINVFGRDVSLEGLVKMGSLGAAPYSFA